MSSTMIYDVQYITFVHIGNSVLLAPDGFEVLSWTSEGALSMARALYLPELV